MKAPLALLALLLAACSVSVTDPRLLIVDLNGTAQGPCQLTDVVAERPCNATLNPNAEGAYVIRCDTIADGLYKLSWDSLHILPVVIDNARGQRICGTLQQWSQLTFSDSASWAAFQATQYTPGPDAHRVALNLLRTAQGSLAVLPILRMPGALSPLDDNEAMQHALDEITAVHPTLTTVAEQAEQMRRAGKLLRLRNNLYPGAQAPRMLFITQAGDSITEANLAKKRWALALLPDSAQATGLNPGPKTRLLLEGDRRITLDATRGHFARIDNETDLRSWTPALIIVNEAGRIERATIGPEHFTLKKITSECAQ